MEHVTITIFLDFDGVLHRADETALNENCRLLENPALFCWCGILEAVLEPFPDVRIIVSSDWRRLFTDDNLVKLLGPALGPRVIGAVETYKSSRADEILVEAQRRGLERWLAIDDHVTVVAARKAGDKRFIVCHPNTGLSAEKVQKELCASLVRLTIP